MTNLKQLWYKNNDNKINNNLNSYYDKRIILKNNLLLQ